MAREMPRVLVYSSGARHNYAVPAIFARAGMLHAFYTDMCSGRGIGRLADVAGALISSRPVKALANRRPNDAVLGKTVTFDAETLIMRMFGRRQNSTQASRALAMHDFNLRLDHAMVRQGLRGATHIYGPIGEGVAFLQAARESGVRTAVDVVIPPSWHDIVCKEYGHFPLWGEPPVDAANARGKANCRNMASLALADRLICPSEFVRDDLVENCGVQSEQTIVVPYSVHESWFDISSCTVPGNILFVGSADLRKGIHYLAMAAEELAEMTPTPTWFVAGGVDERVTGQAICRRLRFLGRVPRNEICALFATADVFVLPSIAEGSASAIYEALASGVPVVTTRAAGSVVRDGHDGFIVSERDPSALAQAVRRIVEDRELRERMSQSARKYAREFTWEAYARRLIPAVLGDI